MRILLAAAPHRDTFGYSMPPPGLLRLGGELERNGIDVALEDLAYALAAGQLSDDDSLADAACERLLARGEFDVVGISVMGATLPIAIAVFERLRERAPHVRTWLGGPGTTGVDALVLERFACIDLVVRGEGEVTVRELIAQLDRGLCPANVAGVTWRDEFGAIRREVDRTPIDDLMTLAPYAWHLLPPISEYKRITGGADGLVPIDSGRGCVYDCSFCTIGRYWSRRSRTLPARRLVEEVLALRTMPGAKSAYLCHDLFGANRGQALAFCEELIAQSAPVPFEVRARADHLDRDLLEKMGQAGGYRVLIGVESADAAVRERNQKGMRRGTDMLRVVDDCADAGVTPILSLILGLPGEDGAALEASLDFCARAALRTGVNLSLHLVNPQPGCELGEEFGGRARAVEGIPPDMAFGTGETAVERALIAAHPDLFTTFALLPDSVAYLRDLHAIATELPEVLMRYPRTFALLRELDHDRTAGALSTYRAWKSSGRSFESFARASGSHLVRAMLGYEQALVRTAARGIGANAGQCVRVLADVVEADFDLPRVAHGLRTGERCGRARTPTTLAVVPARERSPMAGVVTLRLGRDVAALLNSIDGTLTLAELERATPGIARALEHLAESGLVALGDDPRVRSESVMVVKDSVTT